jgi:D-arabinose 1-dehydrogenase-like Zn-dependent alcohol dehydrogenase
MYFKTAGVAGLRIFLPTSTLQSRMVRRRCSAWEELKAILATGTRGPALGPLVSGLATRGKLIVVGAPADPIQLNALSLLFGGRSVYGSLTGTPLIVRTRWPSAS